ncbi:MAG: RCC1 domain-containing protein, partial [Micrococcales bacterium]|nr:RCC1 domain-containing protein [Micrococcales bacterium]
MKRSSTRFAVVTLAAAALAASGLGVLGPAEPAAAANPVTPMIAAGGNHTLALKSEGTVWAWGNNDRGQLGDGTGIDRLTPVQVKGLSGVVAVSAGNAHSLALKSDGT